MALSGSTYWTLTADEILIAALRKVNKKNITSLEKLEALETLNSIVKSLQNDSIFLWTIEWVTKNFSSPSEVLGDNDGLNYTCRRGHTSAAANRPNSGANYTTYWEKTGSSGGTWVTGTAYTAIGDFAPAVDTLAIIQAYIRRDTSDDVIEIIGREKYHSIIDKDITGEPVELYLEKGLTPRIYLYPQPENTTDVLHYQRVKKLQDFDAVTNNADFRDGMLKFLIYATAADLADDYGLDLPNRQWLTAKATSLEAKVRKGNKEIETRSFVQPCY